MGRTEKGGQNKPECPLFFPKRASEMIEAAKPLIEKLQVEEGRVKGGLK
jgi:hypothetical protein